MHVEKVLEATCTRCQLDVRRSYQVKKKKKKRKPVSKVTKEAEDHNFRHAEEQLYIVEQTLNFCVLAGRSVNTEIGHGETSQVLTS